MADYRTERDSLGKVRVPVEAYYGAQTQRAVKNFPISGVRAPRTLVVAMAQEVQDPAAQLGRGLRQAAKKGGRFDIEGFRRCQRLAPDDGIRQHRLHILFQRILGIAGMIEVREFSQVLDQRGRFIPGLAKETQGGVSL